MGKMRKSEHSRAKRAKKDRKTKRGLKSESIKRESERVK